MTECRNISEQLSRDNTIFSTCAVDGADQLPYTQNLLSTELDESRISSVDRAITVVPFTVMVGSKAVILDRQSLYAVPTPSTAQIGILVLPT